MLRRLSLLAVLPLLASCAAVPGYTPPPLEGSHDKSKFAKALESGDVGPEGRYEMSSAEKAMDCKRLTGSIQITISRLKDPLVRQEPSAMSSAAQKLSTPLYGGGSNKAGDRQAIYARERAKLEAYNAELAAKGCKTVDIEGELARPPEPPKKY
ncbi:MAG TPA: hypothetical protein VMR94_05500 [Hyphomicrobiaceae bacterium]|nr:hypothetical protein [Hyphomicrobiaceae bacterium]